MGFLKLCLYNALYKSHTRVNEDFDKFFHSTNSWYYSALIQKLNSNMTELIRFIEGGVNL